MKNIGCPLCRKTMLDKEMAAKYTNYMDELIRNNPFQSASKIPISCNDCGKMNEVDFHPIGRKCVDCGSYNTR
jgi:RING finger/CHY zinc finger protein 1